MTATDFDDAKRFSKINNLLFTPAVLKLEEEVIAQMGYREFMVKLRLNLPNESFDVICKGSVFGINNLFAHPLTLYHENREFRSILFVAMVTAAVENQTMERMPLWIKNGELI